MTYDLEGAQVAYAWVVEGISTIFVSDEVLDDTWAVTQSFLTTHPSLMIEKIGDLTTETSIRDGTFPTNSAQIVLQEVGDSDTLGTIFGGIGPVDPDVDSLLLTIEPGYAIPAAGQAEGKHVGVEFIKADGTRGMYPATPGFTRPLFHLGEDQQHESEGGAALVSDYPVVWAGRRFTLWRVYKKTDGTWQALTDAEKVWWGTLRGQGTHQGGEWAFDIDGPDSWVERWINRRGNFDEPLRCQPKVVIADGDEMEQGAFGSISVYDGDNDTQVIKYGVLQDSTYFTAGTTTFASLAAEFNTFLDDLQTEVDGIYGSFSANNTQVGDLTFTQANGFDITWDLGEDANLTPDVGILHVMITLHEKAWRILGWDPPSASANYEPFVNEGSGMWSHLFTSANSQWLLTGDLPDGWTTVDAADSQGSKMEGRQYDVNIALFDSAAGQEVRLLHYDPVYLQGQLSRPPMCEPDDPDSAYTIADSAGDVTDQRLFLFFGPYLFPGADEPIDIYQIARCSFRVADGKIATDDANNPNIVIEDWYDPRRFHLENYAFSGQWASVTDEDDAIRCIPLCELSWHRYTPDPFEKVIHRLLASTGTSEGWFTDDTYTTAAFGQAGAHVQKAGDNEATLTAGPRKDAEIFDLSLQIPESMLKGQGVWKNTALTLAPHTGSFGCGKVVFSGPASAHDIIRDLLAPRGLAWSLRDRQYCIFDPIAPVPLMSIDVTLTIEAYDNPRMSPTRQGQAYEGPIGAVTIEAGKDPKEEKYNYKPKPYKSADHGASDLTNRVEAKPKAPSLHSPDIVPAWKWDAYSWSLGFKKRWQEIMKFSARRHFPVTVTLHAKEGRDVWPGTRVQFTDASVYNPYTRAYGVENLTGYCIRRSENIADETVEVELFLHADSAVGVRMFSPAARIWAYDPSSDGQGYRLMCHDDFRGFRGATLDVERFVEPPNTSYGGDADVEIWQYTRTGWTGGVYGTVSSVNAVEGDSWLTLDGALTGGTLYRDTDKIVTLRDWGNQGAPWVLALHAPICDEAGEVSAVAGKKFSGL